MRHTVMLTFAVLASFKMFTAIPNNPRELHSYLSTRFLVSGIAISVLAAALAYYWESWRVEKMAFELAVVSAKHFDSPGMRNRR